MATAREVAMLTLPACERQGAWSDSHLKRMLREQRLDSRDAALATRLCFGVLQNRMLIDWHLAAFCNTPLAKLDLKVLCALRVAVYQLLFLDKIPSSAAVNEAVNLTKKHCRNPRAAGMVNGILRSILRQEPLPEPVGCDKAETLSIKYSHPCWLVDEFTSALGEDEVEALLAAANAQPPITAQVNTCKATVQQVTESLLQEHVNAQPHPWLPDCLILTDTGNLERLEAFQSGLFYVQDCAARLAVTAAKLQPGMRVLDCCAAPGGKSFASAIDMKNRGEVISCDIHPHKIKLLEAGSSRLGLDIIMPKLQSAADRNEEWIDAFDAVITDVPCSGLGIIRKKPDIRYKDPAPLAGLPPIQAAILENCCHYVKSGGVLIYATCTLLKRENENIVLDFLSRHPEFELESLDLGIVGGTQSMLTFWPHIHGTDGFFVAKLRKKGGAH